MIDFHFATTAFDPPLDLQELYKHIELEKVQLYQSLRFFQDTFTEAAIQEKLLGYYYHKTMINSYKNVGLNFFGIGLLCFERDENDALTDIDILTINAEKQKPNFIHLIEAREEDSLFLRDFKSTLNKLITVYQQLR